MKVVEELHERIVVVELSVEDLPILMPGFEVAVSEDPHFLAGAGPYYVWQCHGCGHQGGGGPEAISARFRAPKPGEHQCPR